MQRTSTKAATALTAPTTSPRAGICTVLSDMLGGLSTPAADDAPAELGKSLMAKAEQGPDSGEPPRKDSIEPVTAPTEAAGAPAAEMMALEPEPEPEPEWQAPAGPTPDEIRAKVHAAAQAAGRVAIAMVAKAEATRQPATVDDGTDDGQLMRTTTAKTTRTPTPLATSFAPAA